jgi:hypothetical protein
MPAPPAPPTARALATADGPQLPSELQIALGEAGLPFDKDTAPEVIEAMMEHFPADAYPYLAEYAIERVLKPGYDYGDEFEVGLDLILDGLERLLDSA